MKLHAIVTVLTGAMMLAPTPADACSSKHNEIVIVLGVAAGELVSIRLAFGEHDTASDTQWSGEAMLHVGKRITAVGSIAPDANAGKELDRLIAAARAEARSLQGFTPARQVSAKDCTDHPTATCGDVALEHAGKTLRVRTLRTPVAITLPDVAAEDLQVTGVVRYRAGKTEVAVVNLGTGDPKFSTSVSTCEGRRCRPITTLHHGSQTDVVVITAS